VSMALPLVAAARQRAAAGSGRNPLTTAQGGRWRP